MFSSLGTQLALATVLVLVIVSGLLFVELAGRERQGLVAAKLRAANMVVDLFAASLGPLADFGDATGIETAIRNLASNSEVQYAAAWVGDDFRPLAELHGPGFDPTMSETTAPVVPLTRVRSAYIELSRTIIGGNDREIGKVLVRFSLASEDATYRASRRRLLGYSFGIATVTAWVLIALARRQIVRPLESLVLASRRLEQGDDRAAVEVTSQNEVGRLGLAFNNMARAIRDREQRLDETMSRIAKELEEAKREVAVKERLEKEMEIATQIQTALLPRDFRVKGLEIAARMLPASEVGGDYYDVLPAGDGAWLAIGDVSGHGVTAGLIMLMVQSVVSALTKQDLAASPSQVLGHLNRAIYDNIRNRLDQDEFMTLALLRFEQDGLLRFAGAHEEMLICHSEGPCERIATQGTWVGLIPDLEPVTKDNTYQLRHGDLIVLYTDGIGEAMDEAGQVFGVERLCSEIERVRDKSVDAIRDHLLDVVRAYAHAQDDDMTVLVARYARPASL